MAKNETAEPENDKVRCLRTGQQYEPAEHKKCPYCFGEKTKIREDGHEKFCDYDPSQDPIHFGFPQDGSRQQGG